MAGHVCGRMCFAPGAGVSGHKSNRKLRTHSSAELAKEERNICHIALQTVEAAAGLGAWQALQMGVGKWRKIWVTVQNLMAYENQ